MMAHNSGDMRHAVGVASMKCMLDLLLSVPAVTPPGYKTNATSTSECDDGTYRADWKPADAASSCQACGEGILSSATEQITEYAAVNEAPSAVFVRASAAACCKYIMHTMPGQQW